MFCGVTDRIIFHYKRNTFKAEEKETFLYTHLLTYTLCINMYVYVYQASLQFKHDSTVSL